MSTSLAPLLAPMLSSAAMRAICDDAAALQNMLDFEAALARAEAALGVIPASAADRSRMRAGPNHSTSRRWPMPRRGPATSPSPRQGADVQRRQGGCRGGAICPLGRDQPGRDRYGAMLGLRAGIDALLGDIDRAIAGFAALARQHRHTPVVARTWLQHALPMPFG